MTSELQGHHLGARHKYLNLLSKSIEQEYVSFEDVDISAGDIINIVKIDLASKNRNINYILIVLQCEDMFYVSRALKQCPWLISDSGYENIINPEYLHKVLYPKMTSKAVTKLKKYIKLILKDCQRVEQFYANEENEKEALEWLPHCSPDFIVTNFTKHIDHVDIPLLKRLCEKTIAPLEIYLDSNIVKYKTKIEALQATTFLLKIDLKKYLNLVEKHSKYNFKFNSNRTKYILKQDASRIMNNIEFYYSVIDIKTFLNHLKKEDVKHFLYKLFESKKSKERGFLKFEMLVNFLTAMPEADRLETVKQVFLDKIHLIEDKCPLPKPLRISMNNLYTFMCKCKWHFIYDHYWYRFTSFDFAYPQIIKIISNDTSVEEINSIVETLIIVAANSEKDLTELVEYFCKHYKNGDARIKKSIIVNIFKNSVNLNKNTWEKIKYTFMGDIFDETGDPIYDENFVQLCMELIIIHELIFSGKISEIIQERFKFNSLKKYQNKIPEESKEKIFEVLLNLITKKINSHVELNKKEYLNKVELLDSALDLLNDWNKELCDYPVILNLITDFVKVNEENSWDIDFSKIYNKNKSWRKDLFAVSLKMHPSQSVLLNILKHDPTLLEGYTQIENKVYRKGAPLDQYHKKLKIFWPESISKELVHTYEQQLKSGTANKAVIRALCICMPRDSLIQLLIQYIPQQDVINWATIDEGNLNIQQNLATNMHVARPQPGPEIVLDYAKGDYVPHTLPALYSIFYNLNWSQSQKFIPMLLNRKVSLQKHGIRLAFMKLLPMEVKKILTEVLKENKNFTIRHVAFTLTFKMLCKQNNPARIQHLWPIMDNFLNDLTHEENKAIYDLLFQVENLPRSVQSQFFCKAYMFLKSHMTSKKDYYADMKYSFKNLIIYARENCDQLPPEFLKSILLEYIDELPNKVNNFENSSKIELLSAFILCSDTKESISEKCQSVLIPFLQKCYKHWNDINKDVENKEIDESMYFVRLCFHEFMNTFSKDTRKFISEKNTIVPTEAFEIIKNEFQKCILLDTTYYYYLTLTMLQLNYTFLIIFESCKKDGDDWDKTCSRMLPGLAQAISDHLKDHCNKYFTHVYVLFERVLHTILTQYLKKSMILEFLKHLINCDNFIPLYLVVIKLICYHSDEDIKTIKDLLETISSHSSPEVQMHYYHCRNIQLKSITESMICDRIKQKYDKNMQVDS